MNVTVFGYQILISMGFYVFNFSVFFLVLVSIEKILIYTKHSRKCLTTFPNTPEFVQNTPLRVVFSTLFSVFGNMAKHGLSCLIYHFIQRHYTYRKTAIETV